MFNLNNSFLLLANTIYVINLLAFIQLNLRFTKIDLLKFHGFANKTHYYINTFFILNFAGLPPLFFFFFKLIILLKIKNTFFVLVLFMIANTAILYYYINFIYISHMQQKNNLYCSAKINSSKLSTIFYIICIDMYSYLLIDYFVYFFVCLIYLRKQI